MSPQSVLRSRDPHWRKYPESSQFLLSLCLRDLEGREQGLQPHLGAYSKLNQNLIFMSFPDDSYTYQSWRTGRMEPLWVKGEDLKTD